MDHGHSRRRRDAQPPSGSESAGEKEQLGLSAIAEESYEVWKSAVTALMNGHPPIFIPQEYKEWEMVLFPLFRTPICFGRKFNGIYVRSFQDCIMVLEHDVLGFRLGYAVQTLHDMEPDELEQVRLSLPHVSDRMWIVGWMQLFDRVLNLHGVEHNKEARNLCARTLGLLGKWERPEVPWHHNKSILETAGLLDSRSGARKKELDSRFGAQKEEREQLLPKWSPEDPESQSRFYDGMVASLKDRNSRRQKGKNRDNHQADQKKTTQHDAKSKQREEFVYTAMPGSSRTQKHGDNRQSDRRKPTKNESKTQKAGKPDMELYIEEPEGAKGEAWRPPVRGRHVKDEYGDAERDRLRWRFEGRDRR